MSAEIKETRAKLERSEDALAACQQSVNDLRRILTIKENQCPHQFGEPTADNIYHEAYTIPGDKPGTMGVDFRGPTHVPSKIDKRWKRICTLCDKVEHTTRTEATTTHKPIFR